MLRSCAKCWLWGKAYMYFVIDFAEYSWKVYQNLKSAQIYSSYKGSCTNLMCLQYVDIEDTKVLYFLPWYTVELVERIWSALFLQLMACCLFGIKPLPEPMLTYCYLHPQEQISVKFETNINIFIKKNPFEHVVCKVLSILSRPHCDF